MFEISNIGIAAAFGAGMVSFLSPCVLPLVPGYVSYIAGAADGVRVPGSRLKVLALSGLFVIGFSIVFMSLGAGASLLGDALLAYRYELNILGGAIVAVFGLFMLGLLRMGWMMRDFRVHAMLPGGRPLSALLLGLAFAFGWTPCIGPILGSILAVSAASATASDGVALLAIYSLGLGIPFLLAALFVDRFIGGLKNAGRIGVWLHRTAGGALVFMGLAMMTGQLSALSYWLLDAFPVLGTIG